MYLFDARGGVERSVVVGGSMLGTGGEGGLVRQGLDWIVSLGGGTVREVMVEVYDVMSHLWCVFRFSGTDKKWVGSCGRE
jgi:hypothetical protein